MNGAPTHDPREALLAQLNASIDNFFGSGGSVQVLRGFEPVPRRPHHPADMAAGDHSITERLRAEREQLQRVKEAAKTMTLGEAVRELRHCPDRASPHVEGPRFPFQVEQQRAPAARDCPAGESR